MSAKKTVVKKRKAARKKRRRKIPPKTETQVLVKCNYRCCLCYAIDADNSEKLGQIAHIDHNPSNNDLSNLAFLCHEHHTRYDATSLQSKAITEGFLRDALERLMEYNRLRSSKSVKVTLTIDRDFDSFSDEEHAELIAAIRKVAKTKGNVKKLSVSPGSVKIELEMDGEDVARLLEAFERQRLENLNVLEVTYARGIQSSLMMYEEFDAQLGVPSESQIRNVVANPDYSQAVLERKQGSRILVKNEYPKTGFATLAFVVPQPSGLWIVGRGIVIPKDTLRAWPVERPRELLCEFAERFGIPMPGFENRKIVFDQTIPVVYGPISETLVRVFDFKRPETMLYRMSPKTSILGGRSIWLEVACKIGESYAVALKERGFRIDIEKWKARDHKTFYW